MIEYESLDRFHVKGRGDVFSVVNEKTRKFGCPDLIGETVRIDGTEYEVKAVETYCIENISEGMPIGLLI